MDLSGMSFDDVFALAAEQGLKPKRWGSRRLKTYNDFYHTIV